MKKDKVCRIMHECYGINTESIEIINRLFFRQSYLIDDGNKRFVFKKYPRNYEETQLNYIWDIALYLSTYGMDTMELVYKKDGSRFYRDSDDYYVVYKYISGAKAKKEESYEIGRLLKEFHIKCEKIKCEKMQEFTRRLDIVQAGKEIQKFAFYSTETSLGKKIQENIEIFLNCIQSYSIQDNLIIHGDFTLNNVLRRNYDYCIIDFDTIRLGNAIEDMACFVLSLCYTDSQDLKLYHNYKEVAYFLKGYYKDKKMPENIIEKLVKSLKVHCTVELAGHASNYMITKRYTGTDAYLNMLADAVITDGFGLKIGLQRYL
jgi:Ser/Thr protein kinase RdoA (MazF antagonist)